jgi:hypothetical protein
MERKLAIAAGTIMFFSIIYTCWSMPIEFRGGAYLRLNEVAITQSNILKIQKKILRRVKIDQESIDGKFNIMCEPVYSLNKDNLMKFKCEVGE